jgi:hypothetical protein
MYNEKMNHLVDLISTKPILIAQSEILIMGKFLGVD